jgi:hypothetical protein
MTTDIMELWAEIAAGALPEGVTVSVDSMGVDVESPLIGDWVSFKHGLDHGHRSLMLLIVDGWERQGYEFARWRMDNEETRLKEFGWDCHHDGRWLHSSLEEREIIALARVLAELGRAVKEGQS